MRSPAREGGGLVRSGRGKQTSRGGALTRCNVRRTGPVRTSKESESAKGAQTGTLKEGRGHCRTCNRVQWNPCRTIIIAVVTVFGEDVDMGCHCKEKGVASMFAIMVMVDDHSRRSVGQVSSPGRTGISGPRDTTRPLSRSGSPRIVRFLHFLCFLHPRHYPIDAFLE